MMLGVLLLHISSSIPLIFTSPETPYLLKSHFPASQLYELSIFNTSLVIDSLSSIDFDIIIDITYHPHLFTFLDFISEYFSVIYITASRVVTSSFSPWRFYAHNSMINQATALQKLIEMFAWRNYTMMHSIDYETLTLSDILTNDDKFRPNYHFSFTENLTSNASDRMVGTLVKNKGVYNMLLLGEGEPLNLILKSIVKKQLNTKGCHLIVGSKAISADLLIGTVIVVEKGLEFVNSAEEYEYLAVQNALNSMDLSGRVQQDDIINKKYSIVNIRSTGRVIVGSFEGTITITDSLVYLGNVTKYTPSKNNSIVVSIINNSNPDNTDGSLNKNWHQGIVYAANRSNLYNQIPFFHIELNIIDCGNQQSSIESYTQCLGNNNLGVALLMVDTDTKVLRTLNSLQGINKTIPQVSALAQSDILNNATAFPELLKLTLSKRDLYSTAELIFLAFNWKNVVIFTCDDAYYYSVYKQIVLTLSEKNVSILNNEDYRIFHSNYTTEEFEYYKEHFLHAKRTLGVIYIIIAPFVGEIVEGMYDIGLRKGDVIIFGGQNFRQILAERVSPSQSLKRQELFEGALAITYTEWVGNYGHELKDELLVKFDDVYNMCLAFDTMSIVREAVNHALQKDFDYEDPHQLSHVMRIHQIYGCLGLIYFSPDSNSRGYSTFTLQQVIANETYYRYQDIAVLDRFSANLITYKSSFNWPSGSAYPPEDQRSRNICPFEPYKIRYSTQSNKFLYFASFLTLLLVILLSLLITRGPHMDFAILEVKIFISLSDMVFLSFFILEFFQIMAVGPSQDSSKYTEHNQEFLLSLDFTSYMQLKESRYWHGLIIVLSLAAFQCIITTLFFLKSDKADYDILGKLFDYISPIISHIGFLPIFSMLMNIFSCKYGVGDDLSQSYFELDCNEYCYTGKHKVFVVLNSICLAVFIPCSIYSRKVWEKYSASLHLSTKPNYIAMLTIFQGTIVVLSKTIKREYNFAHGIVVSILIGVFLAYSIYVQPYNIRRVNTIQYTSLAVALWWVAVSTFFDKIQNFLAWSLIEFIGLAIIMIGGVYFQRKHPSVLYSQKNSRISLLFRFQFLSSSELYKQDSFANSIK